MENLKYTYALNENNSIVTINFAIKGEIYFCPHCKNIMIVRDGGIKVKHFAHKKRTSSCSYESYLHSLAKKRFEEWFNSDRPFNISINNKDRCEKFENCIWNHDERLASDYCEKDHESVWDLKQYYDLIFPEKSYKGFRADLLLADSQNVHEPIFIEICVSHECEKEKLESGIRIIEIPLKHEYALDRIIQKGVIRENINALLYNFKHKVGVTLTEGLKLNKFVLLESRHGFCPSNRSNCKIYTQRHPSSIFEITFDYQANRILWIPPFIFGWTIAYKTYKNSDNVKNCFLCKYHKQDSYDQWYCCLYKKFGLEKYCKSHQAIDCNYFIPDYSLIKKCTEDLRYVSYNIWKKGMDDKGIDHNKEKATE
ncbi:competence protein CoiA family protein [Bacteroides sp. f07]|uniref:competence protein CoiA family protein n=1 Tax=Bacteroides sp. f07 TaxID=3132704 RepID=UPI0034AF34E6